MNGDAIIYTPTPIRTDDITLSDDLVALTELIAANVHDVWVAGWAYQRGMDLWRG